MRSIALACFSILVVSDSWQGVTARKPSMIPSGEILIQEGDELRIKCHGESESKLQFSTQEIKLFSSRQSKFEISKDEKSRNITFIRPRTKKEDTGWYACAEEGVKITNNEQNVDHESEDIAWVYVYVNSTKLFAMTGYFGRIEVIQGGRVVIPCRPTSPSLPVKLEVEKRSMPLRIPQNTTYDPRIGFIINNIGMGYKFADFVCKTDHHSGEFELPSYWTLVTDPWSKPRINHDDTRHVVWGRDLTIECEIDVPEGINVALSWTVPESVPKERWSYDPQLIRVGPPKYKNHYNQSTWKSELTVRNYSKTDDGEYRCIGTGQARHLETSVEIKSCDPDYTYINASVEGREVLTSRPWEDVRWTINIKTYPQNFTWTWYNPKGRVILSSDEETVNKTGKYSHARQGQHRHIFKISRSSIVDTGNYSVKLSTKRDERTVYLRLTILSDPTVIMMKPLPSYSPGSLATFTCRTWGSPLPNVTWFIEEYPNIPINENTGLKLLESLTTSLEIEGFRHVRSTLEMKVTETGMVTCISCNELSCDMDNNRVLISDVGGRFNIIDPGSVFEGDDVNVTCGASVSDFTDNVTWKPEDREDQGFHTSRISLSRRETNHTAQSILVIHDVRKSDEGKYVCEAVTREGNAERKDYQLVVSAGIAPRFTNSSQHTHRLVHPKNAGEAKEEDKVEEHCSAEGTPTPQITWYKNDQLLVDGVQYKISENNRTLRIEYFLEGDKDSDTFTVTCRATNRAGTAERYIDIKFIDNSQPRNLTLENADSPTSESRSHALFNSSIAILGIVVIIVIGYMSFKLHRNKILRREQLNAALGYFFRNGKVRFSSRHSDEAGHTSLLPDE